MKINREEKSVANNVPGKPPVFTMYEINELRKRRDQKHRSNHDDLARYYKFLIEYEEGTIEFSDMTDAQKRYLWFIKAEVKGMV